MIPFVKRGGMIAAACAVVLTPVQVSATTFKEALIAAYQSNPSLDVTRANLRSQDESVAQAASGMRPSMSLSGVASQSNDLDIDTDDQYRALRVTLNTSLVLFDGGQTANAVNAAENLVFASQANLRSTDQSVLLNAATAYLDVRRDIKFLVLAQNNVRLIEQQVQATEDRFAVGAVTRTDVSLVKARLAAAKTSLAASAGALSRSKEVYRVVVGIEPTNLQSAPSLPHLPSSMSEAESIAVREHPAIAAARFGERAAEFDVARARAARAPVISLGGQVEYVNTPEYGFNPEKPDLGFNTYLGRQNDTQASISLSGQIPIYQGGAINSAMRSATQILESRKFSTQDVIRRVRQATGSSWANLRVARASIVAARLQIEASQIAYDGVQEEVRLGARTVLDLLDAEQNLLSAKSTLASSQRDEYVSAYNLLSSMGLLTVDNLSLGIPAYDPQVHFDQVNRSAKDVFSFSGAAVLDNISDRWK